MGVGSEYDFNTSEESLMQKKLFMAKYQSVIENKRAGASIDEDQVAILDQNMPLLLDPTNQIPGY